jgi:uncharacterized coiled-coil protein SlyX
MTDHAALEDRLRAQEAEIAELRSQLAELQASEARLKEQLTHLEVPKSADPEPAPVAEVVARQEPISDLQATVLQMQNDFSEFRQTLSSVQSMLVESLKSHRSTPNDDPDRAPPSRSEDDRAIIAAYSARSPLDGLLAALARRCGTLENPRLGPRNAADATDTNFVSQNEPDSWLCYDFKERRARLTHYTLRSRSDGFRNSNNPKDWVVEVSDDGERWTEVDRQTNNSDLNDTKMTGTYALGDCPECRYVRLRLTGPAHSGKHFLVVSSFELFGSLRT